MCKFIEIKDDKSLINLCRYGKPDTRVYELYENIEDELINTFGVSDNYLKCLKLKINIELEYAKMFATSDKSHKLLAYALEKELDKLEIKPTKYSLHDSIVAMNKQGIQANINTITVFDFYNFSESVSKLNKL